VDQSLGEFWVANPWDIVDKGHNLSAYERNRAYLNVGGRDFVDISDLTGADSDGDGRSVVAGDFRNDGRLDVVVRQAGGGSVLFFENRFPKAHFLNVSLRGVASNRLGLGARLTARAGGRTIVRELYPHNGFRSQMPSRVHLGLGDAAKVDALTIRWPSGKEQTVNDLPADRHVVITEDREGPAAVETVTPGRMFPP
jgi:hypothetical protein